MVNVFGPEIRIFIPKSAYGGAADLEIIPKKNSFFSASLNLKINS